MSNDGDRKDKVLHTRVSETLDDELRKRASTLGVSVSNLVRNVLTHTFGLVEDVIADSADVARSARGQRAASPRPVGVPPVPPVPPTIPNGRAPGVPLSHVVTQAAEPRVIGWQPLILHMNAVCARCNDLLPRGRDAAIAVTDRPLDGPATRPILCKPCLGAIHEPDDRDPSDDDAGAPHGPEPEEPAAHE